MRLRLKTHFPSWLIVALILPIIFFAWNYSTVESGLIEQKLGYVSDDVWYVSASRNMLREFWGFSPHAWKDTEEYATIVAFDENSKSEALKILLKFEGFSMVKNDYEKHLENGYNEAFAVLAPEDAFRSLEQQGLRVKVYRGYPYPDQSEIINYLNLEHPPLAKYAIALVMLANDSPLAWRFPSLILGSAIVFIVFIVARRVFGTFPGIVAGIFILSDRALRAMSTVAMLDIYLAFLTILSLYFAVNRRNMFASSLSVGLASSAKFAGISSSVAILASFTKKSKIKLILSSFAVPVIVYLLVSLPTILYLGSFQKWAEEILAAIKWHVTPKLSGPSTVDPLGLLFGLTGFYVSYTPPVIAAANFLVSALTIPATILLAPLALEGKVKGGGTLIAWFWSNYLAYVAVYVAGNTTLYAFYAAQFTPLAAVISASIIFFIFHQELAFESLKAYRKLKIRKRKITEPPSLH